MALRGIQMTAAFLVVLMTGMGFSSAQNPSTYFKGKTITIVVGSSTGGGYDTYARLFARYLGKHVPGEPLVIVSNMPGAGSNIAATYVARIAPKDGAYIAAPYAAQPLEPLLDDSANLKYDPTNVSYLGTAASDVFLCIVRSDAPATTFADAFKTQLIMGGTAENGATGYLPILLDNVLGTKFKMVFGYPGTREITLAIQRGEIQGMCGMNWSSINSEYVDLYKSGRVTILAQENAKGVPELNKLGIPLTVSYAHDDEQRRILGIIYSQEFFARPYFVAAGVPEERVRILRRAFMDTWDDPGLARDAKNENFEVSPRSGEEVQSLLKQIYLSPPALIQKVTAAIKLKR